MEYITITSFTILINGRLVIPSALKGEFDKGTHSHILISVPNIFVDI